MRKGIVALGAIALLAANVSWAEGKKETVTVKTADGRTFKADLDTSQSKIMPASTLKVVAHFSMEEAKKRGMVIKPLATPDPAAIYWAYTTGAGTAVFNGSAATYGGGTNNRTLFVGDDTTLTVADLLAGMYWCIANNNASVTQGVFQTFHYDNTGAGGGPGARMFGTGPGWGFAAGNEIPTGVTCFRSADMTANGYVATGTAMWTLATFQDSSGTYAVTPAELNNLGLYICNGVSVGSSTDSFFTASAVGGAVANIAGTIGTLGAAGDNFCWGFTNAAPTPVKIQQFRAE